MTIGPGEFNGFVHELFKEPIGSIDSLTGNVKREDDTSMFMACRLPAPEAFALQRLIFTFGHETDPDDVKRMAENCVFSFEIGYKYYLRCVIGLLPCQRREFEPLRLCGKCRTLYMGDCDCPSCGSGLRPLPLPEDVEPGRQFFLNLLINLVIDNQASFRVRIHTAKTIKLKSSLRMWCHMEGLHARGVQ